MKKTILTMALALSMVAGTAMAQGGMNMNMDDGQDMPQGQGMMMNGGGMGPGMMGGKGMMMQGRQGCMNMMGQGMGQGMMGGGMMNQMSDENQQKFMNDTQEMRQKMHTMRFEHMEAMRNPNTSLKDLADMEQKMLDVRQGMMQKAEKYQDMKK